MEEKQNSRAKNFIPVKEDSLSSSFTSSFSSPPFDLIKSGHTSRYNLMSLFCGCGKAEIVIPIVDDPDRGTEVKTRYNILKSSFPIDRSIDFLLLSKGIFDFLCYIERL